ncbi:MAG: transglycosylase SLT domain-containing protein [Pyrinomonadaceae bacterium]
MSEVFTRYIITLLIVPILFALGCSAQQTEEQALRSLREMTRDGKLPPEDFAAGLESRFAGKKTGALAKLLRAYIRFEDNDFAGAAAILNSDVFEKKTKVADHALWLRGQALQKAGNHIEAIKTLDKLVRDFPDSIRIRDAKLAWANSAIQAGRAAEVPEFLVELTEKNDGDALLLTAKALEARGSQQEAIRYYRLTILTTPGSLAAIEATKTLTAFGVSFQAESPEEWLAMARAAHANKDYIGAAAAYLYISEVQRNSLSLPDQLKYLIARSNTGKTAEARTIFNSLPISAIERERGYRELVLGYAKAKMWPEARATADEMKQKFPNGTLVAKTFVDTGLAARAAKNRTEEGYFLNTAVAAFPNVIEVAQAQFEIAWMQHESNNFAISSQMFTEHLARYADKDTTNRGKAGYWAARDSERAGKTNEACALYDGVLHRYSANWYGYLAQNRLTALKAQGKCKSGTPEGVTLAKAIANLKTVTVAAETATEKELARAEKSDELSIIGLFDWAIDELNEAKKTANNSPTINLALAKHYRLKGDNVNALLALAKSYPDYAQMFPEEMGREEWDIFYPLTNWSDIKLWAGNRGLDKYQVAGLIRQESVFNPRAASSANAYGLMQLLLPTARSMAKKYSSASVDSAEALFQPALNIELGTAYMKDQFAKFGRIEYVAVAYNAGPGRVPQWRATLPAEIDEFVEAIPFKETKGYVQGVIRNTAQYRRLYDETGNFKPNVGTRPLRSEIDTKPRDQFVAENPDVAIHGWKGE